MYNANSKQQTANSKQPINVHFNTQAIFVLCGFKTYETEIIRRLLTYSAINVDVSYVSRKTHDVSDAGFPVKQIRIPTCMAFYVAWHFNLKSAVGFVLNRLGRIFSFNFITGGGKNDVYVFTENNMPTMRIEGKTVVVIHDIIPLRMSYDPSRKSPDSVGKYTGKIVARNTEDVLKRASCIITDSDFSRRDIADYYHIDPERIKVVYCGIDPSVYARKYDLQVIREQYNLPNKYVLYFGACSARKNVETLIRAYSKLSESLRREYKLVITNPLIDTTDCVNNCGISEYVHYIKAIPEADKPAIYQMASVSAWPSLYEGFGLPVLEAMASGVPVICSNVTSMPEVAGDAAILVDPLDASGMAREIERVLTDSELRKDLIAKGYENIKRFSWDESAKKLHDIIVNL